MHLVRTIALAASTLLMVGHATTAAAQSAEPSSTGKGIVGGTLLGAEVVLLTEAAIDVSPNWLYYVGGGAGAVGGGIAGYYLESAMSAKSNMILLASGMLLAIPTTVAVLSATAYEQTAEYTQDQVPADEPKADAVVPIAPPSTPSAPPSPGVAPASPTPAAAPAPAPITRATPKRTRRALPQALIAMDSHSNLHLGIPAVEVRQMYSRAELQRFGLEQRSELRVPLLRLAF